MMKEEGDGRAERGVEGVGYIAPEWFQFER